MIQLEAVSKKFGTKPVLEQISCEVAAGELYGLIGYNGAGKTTLLKIVCGIYRPDSGRVCIAGQPVYENQGLKKQLFIMTEELYFLPQANLAAMRKFYKGYYPAWSDPVFYELCQVFGLPLKQKISGFSKGMQRQAGLVLAFAASPQYLFLDEAFDGLDLARRRLMKRILDAYVAAKGATALITSHNLRELEGIVNRVGMIQDCRLAFDAPVSQMRQSCHQVAFSAPAGFNRDCARGFFWKQLDRQPEGGFAGVAEGEKAQVLAYLAEQGCSGVQLQPVTLEEYFLTAKEELKYDFQALFQS